MTNHQCYCYGIIAITNLKEEKYPITSELFYDELYYLWDLYSEEGIEQEYKRLVKKGKMKE